MRDSLTREEVLDFAALNPGYNRSSQTGARMPEVYVHAVEGRSPEQKKALMKDITDAVVKHFNATPDNVVVTIVESLKVNKSKAGVPFSEK
jgi:4-oxalocrotonate tautomerase